MTRTTYDGLDSRSQKVHRLIVKIIIKIRQAGLNGSRARAVQGYPLPFPSAPWSLQTGAQAREADNRCMFSSSGLLSDADLLTEVTFSTFHSLCSAVLQCVNRLNADDLAKRAK